MEKRIEASTLASDLGPVLDDIAASRAEYVLTRNGKPVAALIAHRDLLTLRKLKNDLLQRFDRFQKRMAEETGHLTDEEVAADVAAAVADVRAERRTGSPAQTR